MNIVEQERQKFEQWLRTQPHVLNVGFNRGTQEYILGEDQDQWIGWQARAELSLKAEARIDDLEKKLRREEEEHGNTINQRDQAEACADMLSSAIGNHFRVEVGEHSNMNCPWFEAEKVMNGEYITDSDEEREISRLKNENEKYNQRYLNDLDLFGKCQEKENYQQQRVEELEFLLKEALPWLTHYEACHGTPEEVTLLARIIEGKLK